MPSEAIINGAVFRVSNDRLTRVPIKTGIRGTRMVEVQAGLEVGMRVASPAKPEWRDGQRVHVSNP